MASCQLCQRAFGLGTASAVSLSLLPLAILATLATSGRVHAGPSVVAESLFRVHAERPVVVDDGNLWFDAREYELSQKTQLALLKSDFVLRAALRDPAIASLSIFAGKSDPVAWLADNLEVRFVDGSEILSIQLRGSREQADDLRQVVDAVSDAYKGEVVYSGRAKELALRDMLAKEIDRLREKIQRKMRQIAEEKSAIDGNSPSSDFNQRELDVLLTLWGDLVLKLENVDINTSSAPDRIHQLQPAVVR